MKNHYKINKDTKTGEIIDVKIVGDIIVVLVRGLYGENVFVKRIPNTDKRRDE